MSYNTDISVESHILERLSACVNSVYQENTGKALAASPFLVVSIPIPFFENIYFAKYGEGNLSFHICITYMQKG